MKLKIPILFGLLAVLGLATYGSVFLVDKAQRVGINQGYSPVQPIAFNHRLHAGERQIPCLYCHFGAEKSRHAGIPPLNVCMNCHTQLKVATPEVQKLKEAVLQQRPVQWVKIHNLPDFVYFNHSQHVLHPIACQKCHGPIETMDRVSQVSPLTMGWCINCHRDNGVTPPSQHGMAVVKAGTHAAIGGTDCSKCHY